MARYVAIVISHKDPEGFNRIQVRIPEIHSDDIPDSELPWATIELPVGATFNEGIYLTHKEKSFVWVCFPWRDSKGNEVWEKPLITGGVQYWPDGLPNIPHEVFNGVDSLNMLHQRPEDPDIELPNDNEKSDTISLFGVVVQFMRNCSFRITQKTTKSAIEISKSGNIGNYSQKNIFLSARDKIKLIADEVVINAKKGLKMDLSALKLNLKNLDFKSSGTGNLDVGGGFDIKGGNLSLVSREGSTTIYSASNLDQSVTGQSSETVNIKASTTISKKFNLTTATNSVLDLTISNTGDTKILTPIYTLNLNSDGSFSFQNKFGAFEISADGGFEVSNDSGACVSGDNTGKLEIKNNIVNIKELFAAIEAALTSTKVVFGSPPNPAKIAELKTKAKALLK